MTRQLIQDSLSALSVVLVFVTVLFGIKYPIIVADFKPRDVRGQGALTNERQRLIKSFFANTIPVVISNVVAFLVILPLTVQFFRDGSLSLLGPDILPNLFLFISVWQLILAVWSIYLLVRAFVTIALHGR